MIRLSIIIPFYNVEKYIAECLDSVFNQDIPEEEYEVICVNDASPDGSRDIVLRYQKQHPNLILVEHEVNKKLGAARNTGRHAARGKFLWNVDSDDMIAPNCLGVIIDKCERDDLDVLLFGFSIIKDGKVIEKECPWLESAPCSGLEFWEKQIIPHQSEISQVWTQVYRKSFLDDNNIYSPEINMSEDEPYTYSSLLKAGHIAATDKRYYIFRENNQSLTRSFQKKPNPEQLYEMSYLVGRFYARILYSIPRRHKAIRRSIRGVVQYSNCSSWSGFHALSISDKHRFRSICRRNFFNNLFVFGTLSKKQLLRYVLFLVNG